MTAPSPRTTKRKAAAGRAITPEDVLRYHFLADPQISPEGRHVVFVEKHVGKKNDYVTNLWLVSRAGTASRNSSVWGEPRQFTNGGKDTHPRWSPDGTRIAFIGARDKHNPQVFTMSAEGGEATALTELPEGSIGALKWSPDGQFIAISFRAQDPQWTQDAKKQRQEKGLSDPPRVLDHWWYRLDGDGYFNGQRYQLYLVDAETGEHRVLYTKDTLGFFSFDFSPDSKQMIIGSNTERRAGLKPWNDTLLRLNIATGKTTAVPGLPR
ncbi:MAG: TolB family protein, partial [Planctomycetota bacterium]